MSGAGYFGVLAGFLMVLGLMAMTLFALKRLSSKLNYGGRGRLKIVEMLAVDTKRRAVLLKRDNKEHLILVGGVTDVIIEAGIDSPLIPELINDQKTNP